MSKTSELPGDIWAASGTHICHLYETFAEQKTLLLPFLSQGLRDGEHCICVTNEQSVDDWFFELQAFGVDVEKELQSAALRIVPAAEWPGLINFNSLPTAREVLDLLRRMQGSFGGVRIAWDSGWAAEPHVSVDKLCHWEATSNLVYRDQEVRVLCQYDLSRQSPAAIHSALRTHPDVIVDGRLVPNPYFEAKRILDNEPNLNHSDGDALTVEGMLDRLRSAA